MRCMLRGLAPPLGIGCVALVRSAQYPGNRARRHGWIRRGRGRRNRAAKRQAKTGRRAAAAPGKAGVDRWRRHPPLSGLLDHANNGVAVEVTHLHVDPVHGRAPGVPEGAGKACARTGGGPPLTGLLNSAGDIGQSVAVEVAYPDVDPVHRSAPRCPYGVCVTVVRWTAVTTYAAGPHTAIIVRHAVAHL